jgi:hypothetical protein
MTTNSTGQQNKKHITRTKSKLQNSTKNTQRIRAQKTEKHRKYITEHHITAQNSTGQHMPTQNKKHITEQKEQNRTAQKTQHSRAQKPQQRTEQHEKHTAQHSAKSIQRITLHHSPQQKKHTTITTRGHQVFLPHTKKTQKFCKFLLTPGAQAGVQSKNKKSRNRCTEPI